LEPFNSKEGETAYLKSIQEGAVKSSKGELDGEKEIALDGLRGREFFVKVSENKYVRTLQEVAAAGDVDVDTLV
jgi:hypothetical protein